MYWFVDCSDGLYSYTYLPKNYIVVSIFVYDWLIGGHVVYFVVFLNELLDWVI